MSFTGFTDGTLEFFMALRFNNNREFFNSNHDWYVDEVRKPALALSEELGRTVEEIDPELERRPARTLSHINRDIRFSHDKTPYRDFFWIVFHGQGEDRYRRPEFYFLLGPDGCSCGMGIYDDDSECMARFRQACERRDPELIRAVGKLNDDYEVTGRRSRKITVPDTVPETLARFYPLKGFYLEHAIGFSMAKTAQLAGYVADRYRQLSDLYRAMTDQ